MFASHFSTAVVCPAMSYGATIWYTSREIKMKGLELAVKLTTLQNKCLQSITGAYKATNTKVLEAEAGVIPLDIHLDQIILRARDNQRCKKVIYQAKEKIHHKLKGKRGRRSQPKNTPIGIKDAWAKSIMEKLHSSLPGTNQQEDQDEPLYSKENLMKKWIKRRWEEQWETYLNTVPSTKKTSAHKRKLRQQQNMLYQDLRKAESSLAVQLCIEKVEFAAFLHICRVPEMVSPACQCEWHCQNPKHIIIFCSNHALNHCSLYEAAGTDRYWEIMSTRKNPQTVACWVMSKSLLLQFLLAKEQVDWVENRAVNESSSVGDGVGDSENEDKTKVRVRTPEQE